MRAAVPAPTPVLLGYADRFSAQAGDTLRFMVSCEAPSFDARLVRLIHGDNNPDGPGYRDVLVPSEADGAYPGKHQVIAAGSYIRVPVPAALDLSRGLTVQAWVWPTMPAKAQAILAGPDGSFFLRSRPRWSPLSRDWCGVESSLRGRRIACLAMGIRRRHI